MADTNIYRGSQIIIDLPNGRCQRLKDGQWLPFKNPRFVVISQVRMNQSIYGGLGGASTNAKYNAFCVFIKTEKLNIMAYRGRRDKVMEEAERISNFLGIPVKDMIPRNPDGSITDDDHVEKGLGCLGVLLAVFLKIIS